MEIITACIHFTSSLKNEAVPVTDVEDDFDILLEAFRSAGFFRYGIQIQSPVDYERPCMLRVHWVPLSITDIRSSSG